MDRQAAWDATLGVLVALAIFAVAIGIILSLAFYLPVWAYFTITLGAVVAWCWYVAYDVAKRRNDRHSQK
jgi:bacteriorhodopsin